MRKISWGCNSPVCLWTQPESFAPPKIETPNSRVYQKFQEQFTFTWAVLGGVKFPTGDSHRLGDPDLAEGIGGQDLALGSGSFDGIVGTGILTRWKRLLLTANMQYGIRSESAFHHRYANDLTWKGGPGVYLAWGHKYTLSLQGVVSGEASSLSEIIVW